MMNSFKTKTLAITYELIKDTDILDDYFNDFDAIVAKEVIARLNNWLSFFNNDFIKYVNIYSYTIFALIDVAKKNHLFRSQTRYETETSLAFYEKAINSGHFIHFSKIEEAVFFLNTSLIYGCFPGMVIGSTKRAFFELKKHSDLMSLHQLFKQLFVRYEIPMVFLFHLPQLDKTEIHALMYILQGNNIRNFNDLPIPISKKESHLFINSLPHQLTFKDRVLERSLVASKLLLSNPTQTRLLYSIINSSKIFQFRLADFHKDILFWKSIFRLMSKINWNEETEYSIQEYIDFFEFKRYSLHEDYTLKGRTLRAINQAIEDMHEASFFGILLDKIDLKWIGSGISPMKINYKNEAYLVEEITNGKDLYQESLYLKHCVYAYINECGAGDLSIWSLQIKVNSIYQPLITIEIKHKTITQKAGKRNREITKTEEHIIEIWAKSMNYSCQKTKIRVYRPLMDEYDDIPF